MTRVLVVGAVSWNLIVELGDPVPPAPATVFARSSWETLSATGAGKALNLARLGLATTLQAFVGDDAAGRRIAAELSEAGVEARLGIDPSGTERHVNLMQPDGGRSTWRRTPEAAAGAGRDGNAVVVRPARLGCRLRLPPAVRRARRLPALQRRSAGRTVGSSRSPRRRWSGWSCASS